MKPFRITVIGAESTGKTTLSRDIADALGGDWVCEFARPYLEITDGEVTKESMRAIWYGQHALQHSAAQSPRHYVVHDTDLFATVGYWQLPHVTGSIGNCPDELVHDALADPSDLYLITLSNIPFEQDPLRYGGTVRESPDSYWIELCKTYHLPALIISSSSRAQRLNQALSAVNERNLLCMV